MNHFTNYLETRRAYLQECRALYYTDNWIGTSARSLSSRGSCLYTTEDGRSCAAGRLNPDASWTESISASAGNNIPITLKALEDKGMHSGSQSESLSWVLLLQKFHDSTEDAKSLYEQLMKYDPY